MKARLYVSFVLAASMYAAGHAQAQSETQANYVAKCQACHGPTGAGETATGKILQVKSFNDSTVTSMTDPALNGVITSGSGKMPAYQNIFSNDQISNLVQYLHQLQTNLQSQ